ncbi:ATP-dependent helicase [Anaerosacchariphilus polymeriproducens]|uniref:DNA 3'-5' helicase n=1 Tax=Anaerosacchariphilus polymeriproducens TaxID=1812858 RepID=A0A371AXI9_9FIRM|nr:ATP-dependent helicase [Anaerosacchariphilus polymeriproducens]RDU24261.1 ATP-dependent helicase [Anaerosacchariphilus polymeriproducens]
MNYNQSQKQAIHHKQGPMLVLAGPGSGKTAVITRRTQFLIEECNINPKKVLVITFTKAAAREMKERFESITNGKRSPVTFGTFHGVFFSILKHAYGYNSSNILPEGKSYQLVREILDKKELDIEMEDETDFIADVLNEISTVKNERIPLEHYYSKSCPEHTFRNIFIDYQDKLQKSRFIDFDDMLVYCYELLVNRKDILTGWQNQFEYILIDEFQDINKIQYDIIRLLAKPENNLFVVGDDDQSIYRFRGAKPEIMLNYKKDYPKAQIVLLDKNYRSTDTIVTHSLRLIKKNSQRYKKDIKAVRNTGELIEFAVFQNQMEENNKIVQNIMNDFSKGKEYSEIAILFRTNTQPRMLVEKLMEYNIPFCMKDILPNIYEHWMIKNIIAYIQISLGSRKRSDFLQIINRPKRYISRDCINHIEISFENLLTYYQDKEWMCDYIEKLWFDINQIKNMRPYAAINYIRKAIGYDEYIKEYALFRKMNPEELLGILNEVQELSKDFSNFQSWFLHMEEYVKELKEQQLKKSEKTNAVTLMTMHSAKGLEYNQVYIVDVSEEIVPHPKAVLEEEIEEERRMFYVGVTRAKEKLFVYSIKERFQKKLKISRFVEEMMKE